MAEPDKRQIGDGSDNYGEAAKQMAKAAKEAGKETAKQAAVKGAEAGANAAAATVQAGVEGGKAVAEIAAGTAAGGPWGAILSAAWAMRHTLFKILVCICLFFLVITCGWQGFCRYRFPKRTLAFSVNITATRSSPKARSSWSGAGNNSRPDFAHAKEAKHHDAYTTPAEKSGAKPRSGREGDQGQGP